MRTGSLLLVPVVLALFSQGAVLADSVEITTGSGPHEGILGPSGEPLRNGSLIQVIRAGGDHPQPPDAADAPSPPDELLATTEAGFNFPFSKDQGKFDCQVWADAGERVYVRAWSGVISYGDSEVYTVKGRKGEIWNLGGRADSPAMSVKERVTEKE